MLTYSPFGEMTVDPVFGLDQLKKVGHRSSMWQILEAFTRQTEGVASRVAFGAAGALILTTIPGDPNSGAFYLYNLEKKTFFSLNFERADNFNVSWFDMVVTAYDLQDLIYRQVETGKKPVQFHRRRRHHHRRHRSVSITQHAIAA